MNMSHSRGKNMVLMALNKQQSEKMLMIRSQASCSKKKIVEDDDPDFHVTSSYDESDDSVGEELAASNEPFLDTAQSEEVGGDESVAIAKFFLEHVLQNAMKNFTARGEKRKRQKYDTSVTERKLLKHTELIRRHTVKPPCNEKCKKKCTEGVSHERRVEINREYWTMSSKERKTYMFNYTQKSSTKRPTTTTGKSKSRRQFTIKYFCKDQESNRREICKPFFLSTLGYNKKGDRPLRTVMKNTSNNRLQAVQDLRGRHPSSQKIDTARIINHINSFGPSISHYRREHAPNRKYLPTDLNVQIMYNDFKNNNKDFQCSYELYRKTLKEMNISFVKLGHEECFACEKFFLHKKDSSHKREAPEIDCGECKEYNVHRKKAEEARICYGEDKNDETGKAIYSADLQKVIMLPRYESLKEVIFTGRIIAFNESFVPVGKKQRNKKAIAVIWHEGVAGRSKTDIISAFYSFFLRHRDEEHIVLWLDNFSAQNKNWALLAFFVNIVNSDSVNLKKLDIKFFEPGHTFMSADSFHHQVEMQLKRKRKVFDFGDFEECVQKSNGGRVIAINMKCHDFYNWGDFTSAYKLKNINPRPYLQQMVHLQYSRGDFNMQYKTSFHGDAVVLNFLNIKIIKNGFPTISPRNVDRGISAERKHNIVSKLGGVIPKNRIQFWEDLHVSSTPALEEDEDA